MILKISLNKAIDFTDKKNSSRNDNNINIKIKNLAKSKMSNFTKAKTIKKWVKFKKPDFIKINFIRSDFCISKARTSFIYLSKALTKTLIFKHFNLEHYI